MSEAFYHSEASSRTELLIGTDGVRTLSESHVLLVGLGGVGGSAAEMLARAGVGRLTLVDPDEVQRSNLNRQLIALQETVGKPKVDLWKERLHSINPQLNIDARRLFVRDELTEELLRELRPDFVIDAIDTLSPKVHLIKSFQEHWIPFISVMGTGAMLDPTQLRISRMDKVKNCPLARMIRKRLRKLNVSLKFSVVYSEELPIESAIQLTEGEQNKKSITGTIAYNPTVAGCYAAYQAITHLLSRDMHDGAA